jgi:hypothetical protein
VTISFVVQKLFNFMSILSYLSILLICQSLLLATEPSEFSLGKSLPMPINSSVFSTLSCTSFTVSDLILRSLIHFELILVLGERHGFSFSFLHADT